MILASIAMQEMGISHILNAEAEKLQYVLGTLRNKPLTPAELSEIRKVNCSARDTIKELLRLEMLLQAKLDTVKAFTATHEHCAPEPEPAPDPRPCPDPLHSNSNSRHGSNSSPDPNTNDPSRNSPDPNSNHTPNASNASDPYRFWRPQSSNSGCDDTGFRHTENLGEREHHTEKRHRTVRCIMRTRIPKRCRGNRPCLKRGRPVQRRSCRRKKRCVIHVRQTNKPVMKNVIIIKNIARNHAVVCHKNRNKAAAGTDCDRSPRRRSRRPAGLPHRRTRRRAKAAVRETMFPGLLPHLRK